MSGCLERVLDWVYPKRAVCMGCGSAAGFEMDWLCGNCRKALARNWIGAFMDAGLDGAAAAYAYQGPAGGMVRRLKYQGLYALAEPMADSMFLAYAQILPTGADMVTAVPMHPKRLRRRGFNHAEALARGVARRLELPYAQALIRTRDTVQQARLEGEARRRNLQDAFSQTESLKDRRVLLVDDVYTTGETARQCAKALRMAGARSVSFLAYAKGNV